MPPFISLDLSTNCTESAFLGLEDTPANCETNVYMKIGLGVVSVLFGLSEFMSLSKFIPVSGFLQGIMLLVKNKMSGTPATTSEEKGLPNEEQQELSQGETQAKVQSITGHLKDAYRKLVA